MLAGNAGVLLPESGVHIVFQAAEHGLVAHPVSVDERVKATESGVCPVVQKDRTRRILLAVPRMGEVVPILRQYSCAVKYRKKILSN